jgi:hypothetical protein
MKKIIIIGSCVDCPHFIDAFKNSRFKESCILKHKNVYYDKNTHTYPIPKWCPLDRDDTETDIENDTYLYTTK